MNTATPPPVLHNRDSAAKFLGVSVRQLDSWIKCGSIQPTRLGRLVKIHQSELQRIAEQGIAL